MCSNSCVLIGSSMYDTHGICVLRGRNERVSSRLLPILLVDGLLDERQDNGDWGGNWYARDLAYGFDTLVENVAGEMERRGKKGERRSEGGPASLNRNALVGLSRLSLSTLQRPQRTCNPPSPPSRSASPSSPSPCAVFV